MYSKCVYARVQSDAQRGIPPRRVETPNLKLEQFSEAWFGFPIGNMYVGQESCYEWHAPKSRVGEPWPFLMPWTNLASALEHMWS